MGIRYLHSAVEGGVSDAGFQLGKLYEHVLFIYLFYVPSL